MVVYGVTLVDSYYYYSFDCIDVIVKCEGHGKIMVDELTIWIEYKE